MTLAEKAYHIINKSPFLRVWRRRIKRFTLPGFDKVPVYDVVVFFVNETQKDGLIRRAKSIAFTFFMAFFPMLIFVFSLIPFIPVKNFQQNIIQVLRNYFKTDDVYQFFQTTIENVITKPKTGLLSIGLLTALFLASNGMMAVMDAFDKTYDYYVRRNFIQKRWVAIKLLFLIAAVFVLANSGVVFGIPLIKTLLVSMRAKLLVVNYSLLTLNYFFVFLVYLIGISAVYYYGPALKRKFRFFSTGSTVATILSLLLSILFSIYVQKFFKLDKLYGSIASMLLVLIYFYMNSIVILIGFELNAAIYHHQNLREKSRSKSDYD